MDFACIGKIPNEKEALRIRNEEIKLPNNWCQKNTKAFKNRFRNKELSCHMAFFIKYFFYVRRVKPKKVEIKFFTK